MYSYKKNPMYEEIALGFVITWLVFGFLWGILTCLGVILVCFGVKLRKEMLIAFRELRIEMEEDAEHHRLSLQGAKGTPVREENKEMRQAALAEGRQVISSVKSPKDALPQLLQLIKKYPRVAEGVARQLNREYRISSSIGISEDTLLEEVAKVLVSIEQPPQPKEKVNEAW